MINEDENEPTDLNIPDPTEISADDADKPANMVETAVPDEVVEVPPAVESSEDDKPANMPEAPAPAKEADASPAVESSEDDMPANMPETSAPAEEAEISQPVETVDSDDKPANMPDMVMSQEVKASESPSDDAPANMPEMIVPPEVTGKKETSSADEKDEQVEADAPAEQDEDALKQPIIARNKSYGFNQMVANFAGCGRCSYFLAGYRVLHGEKVLETAVSRMKADKLKLPWSYELRELLIKSYGVYLDTELLHYSGSCPECGRTFLFKEDGRDQAVKTIVIHCSTTKRARRSKK